LGSRDVKRDRGTIGCPLFHTVGAYCIIWVKGKMEEDFSSITMTVNWMGFLDRYKREIFCTSKPNMKAIKTKKMIT